MSRQYWSELVQTETSAATAVANTTTETVLFPDVTIPANYMQDGRVLRMRAFGQVSTTATPTMTWAIRWGGVSGTILWQSEALTMASGAASFNWEVEVLIQTRTNGSSGTLIAMGEVMVNTSTSANLSQVVSISGSDLPAAATVDLTTNQGLSITAKWSAASASNTITGHIRTLEALN